MWVCENKHDNWINPVAGSIVFVIKDGQALFGVRSIDPNPGKLCLPGGFIELGESAEQTAVREVKAELGIDVTVIDFLGSYPSTYTNGRATINFVFIADYTAGEVTPGDDLNGGDPMWRDIENLPAQDDLAWEWYADAQKDLSEWWQRKPGK